MNVLVVGSTGFLGTEICRLALEAGHHVRGLVRSTSDPDRVAALRAMGVETVEGDLKEPGSLPEAVRGVNAVISTATATRTRQDGDDLTTVDRDGQRAVVDAAATAGVGHFVLVSFSGSLGGDDALTVAKRAVEERVRGSGMTYTILRPTCFMEVWLSPALGFDAHGGSVTIYGDGTQPLSWISLLDVARFAVRALEEPSARDAVTELGGPEALTPLEVVAIFEEETGGEIRVQHVSTDELRSRYEAARDPLERSFASLMIDIAKGDAIPMEETLGIRPGSLRTVRDHARSGAGADADGQRSS